MRFSARVPRLDLLESISFMILDPRSKIIAIQSSLQSRLYVHGKSNPSRQGRPERATPLRLRASSGKTWSGSGHFIGLLEFAADPCGGLYETTSGLESRLALGWTALAATILSELPRAAPRSYSARLRIHEGSRLVSATEQSCEAPMSQRSKRRLMVCRLPPCKHWQNQAPLRL